MYNINYRLINLTFLIIAKLLLPYKLAPPVPTQRRIDMVSNNDVQLAVISNDDQNAPHECITQKYVNKDWATRINEMLLQIERIPKFRRLIERVVEATLEQVEIRRESQKKGLGVFNGKGP